MMKFPKTSARVPKAQFDIRMAKELKMCAFFDDFMKGGHVEPQRWAVGCISLSSCSFLSDVISTNEKLPIKLLEEPWSGWG